MSLTEGIVLAVVAVLLLLAMRFGKRQGENTRAARLMKQYAVMTRAKLDTAPAGELVDAVVSRVLAKAAESRRPEPLAVLANLPHPNTVVYSVWVVCKEMASGGYAAMMKTAARSLADAVEGHFIEIGAGQCATAFAVLHRASEKTAAMETELCVAIQTECPLTLCEAYIRDHADDFLDK